MSGPARYIRYFFYRASFFPCDFFVICFHRSPLSFFQKRNVLRAWRSPRCSGLWDLPKYTVRLFFFEVFSVGKMFFCCFSRGKWFSSLIRIPSGIFWRCKIDENWTILSFWPWLSVLYCLLGFSSKVHNFLRKCVRSTASPLCLRYASIFEDESLKAQILCPAGAYSTKIPLFGPSVGHRLQMIPFCFLLLRRGIQVLLCALTRKFFPYIESKRLTNFLLCSEEICCIVTVNYLWNSPNGGHARVLTQGTCYFEMNWSANKTSE